jgi:hypothetical protein
VPLSIASKFSAIFLLTYCKRLPDKTKTHMSHRNIS